MRAVIVSEPGGTEVLRIGEAPDPRSGPGEVLVKTVAAGVNRADLLQRRGHYPPPEGTTGIMGLEASGVVAGVGEGVTRWREGEEVVALLAGGGYAEYFVAPEHQVIAPPANADLVTAAGLIEVAATAISNLEVAGLSTGETLLVHGGSGGIGTFAIQYASAMGCRVIATAGTPDKLRHCREHGAGVAIDYHADWVQAVKDATKDRGVDVVLDIMGAKYLEPNVEVLARGGRLVVIGMQGGIKGTLNLAQLLGKQGTVTASSLRFRSVEEKGAICHRVEQEIWPQIDSGLIRPAPETRIPFEEVRRAHELLESGNNLGKIVLQF